MDTIQPIKTTLICTVGGSHQPILAAIRDTQPDYVCFICTDRDPETNRPGSVTQITGKGSVIKAHFNDKKPTLPNIPTQAELDPSSYETLIVPADDLDDAFSTIRSKIQQLADKFPESTIIADYTGGTKTMAAALVTAVLESEDIKLQLVTGARSDLVKVADQTEYTISANVDQIRLERDMAPFLNAWKRFAYDEACEGLSGVIRPRDAKLRARLNLLQSLSRGFAAWDRFDHASALKTLETYRNRIGKDLGTHFKALTDYLVDEQSQKAQSVRLYDLWLNAKRRAAQGHYDDAVARVYRLIEWTAQWQLRIHCDIDTADVPPEKIPEGISLSGNREGGLQAGLYQAWQLVDKLIDGPAALFIRSHVKELLDHLQVRNSSILAHGYTPVDREQWDRLSSWMEDTFLPMLKQVAKKQDNIRFDLDLLQLPTTPPTDNS